VSCMDENKNEQMGILEVALADSLDSDLRESIVQHYSSSQNLQRLIFDWVKPGRSVVACNADCDPGEEDGFILTLMDKEIEAAEIVVSMNWLRRRYSNIRAATERELPDSEDCVKVWSPVIADFIFSEEDNFNLIISYLFTDYSCVWIDCDDDWIYEMCSEEELATLEGRLLVAVSPHYQHPKTGEGFGETCRSLGPIPTCEYEPRPAA